MVNTWTLTLIRSSIAQIMYLCTLPGILRRTFPPWVFTFPIPLCVVLFSLISLHFDPKTQDANPSQSPNGVAVPTRACSGSYPLVEPLFPSHLIFVLFGLTRATCASIFRDSLRAWRTQTKAFRSTGLT